MSVRCGRRRSGTSRGAPASADSSTSRWATLERERPTAGLDRRGPNYSGLADITVVCAYGYRAGHDRRPRRPRRLPGGLAGSATRAEVCPPFHPQSAEAASSRAGGADAIARAQRRARIGFRATEIAPCPLCPRDARRGDSRPRRPRSADPDPAAATEPARGRDFGPGCGGRGQPARRVARQGRYSPPPGASDLPGLDSPARLWRSAKARRASSAATP